MYASVGMAGNNIYAVTRKGGVYLYRPGSDFEVIAHNTFDDDSDFNASPSFSDGQLFLRSNRYLYCIGQ